MGKEKKKQILLSKGEIGEENETIEERRKEKKKSEERILYLSWERKWGVELGIEGSRQPVHVGNL